MINNFKNILLAGLGSAAYTYEKSMKLVDEFVEKGKLTLDEGKELSEELKRNVKQKTDSIKPLTKDDIYSLLKEMNLATKEDVEKINERLCNLENSSIH